MATRKVDRPDPYTKIEQLVIGKIYELENENTRLKNELAVARAKLDVYERLANISGTKTQLGFGPPIINE